MFAYLFEKVTVTLCIASFIFGIMPDIDQADGIKQFTGHRNILTHSIILWVIVAIFNPDPIFILIPAVIGLHCLMDMKWRKKQRVGYANITITNGIRLGGTISTLWLIGNFLVSFITLILWCLI